MSKSSLHVLTWSNEHQRYELHAQGQVRQAFRPEAGEIWQNWLSEHTSFAFQGRHGQMSVVKEDRLRGAGYWYGYSTQRRRTNKRYLGPTPRVTLERLEQEAQTLAVTAPKKSPTSRKRPGSSQTSLIPLLATKYILPRLPSTLVKRERLLSKLNSILEHQLLLFSAAAGSGKTTLLSTWATQTDRQVAWLALDDADNEPAHFWISLIGALRYGNAARANLGDIALAMLCTAQPTPLPTVLTVLVNEIVSYADDIILILDDYHIIDDQLIQESILFLLEHLPANLHLILSCRVDPALPFSRWRARGQLVEIRQDDMRFTREETTGFLRQGSGQTLSDEEIELLEARTEGWIAGLQLAAISLNAHASRADVVQNFSGSQRFILDYMQDEILQRQSSHIQNFLLHCAILDRLNASICQALTDDEGSQETLETLERNNLFLLPLDGQRQWYRLHSLFREALLAQLRATQPELIPTLHQRAARWYNEAGYSHEAIAHALAAHDYELAASIMEHEASQLWMQGEARTIASWVLELPDAVLWKHLDFTLTAALNLLWYTQAMPEQPRTEGWTQSECLIARVEQALRDPFQDALSPDQENRLRNRIHVLHRSAQMNEALRAGNIQLVRSLAQEMQPLTAEDQVLWKWLPCYGLFMSAQWLGDAVSLLPELQDLKQQAFQEHDQATAIIVMCWISAALWDGGHLRLLQQECLQAQGLLEQLGNHVSVGAYPAFDLSFLYYERNQLEKTEACLRLTIEHAQRWQDMNLLVSASGIYVQVLLTSGKVTEAEQVLQETQDLRKRTGLTLYEANVMAAQVSLWLAQGELAQAQAWAEQYTFNPNAIEYLREGEYLALAHIYLWQQQYERCLQVVEPLLSRMEQVERIWDIIHLLALQAVALHGQGEHSQARQAMIRLLNLTEPEGYIRVYLDAGQPMQQLLETFITNPDNTISTSFVSQLLAAFRQEKDKRKLAAPSQENGTENNAASANSRTQEPQSPFEPLSPQERRVLQLLVAGRTYAEMAQELIVSTNTIKTQVSSIYRKLGVGRRAEASAVAQQLQLV